MMRSNPSQAVSNLGEVAYLRRFELQHREQVETLTRQLMDTEKKLEEMTRSYKECKQELDLSLKENKVLERRYNKLVALHQKVPLPFDASSSTSSRVRTKGRVSADDLGSSSSKNSISNTPVTPSVVNTLKLELRKANEMIKSQENEIVVMKEAEEERSAQIRVLEDALDFHTREMGLSGQADLLSSIASLRGEVAALQQDLVHKKDKLNESEKANEAMNSQKQSLERQIESMYERLMLSDARLEGTDMKEYLDQVERERDLLLEYVRTDMEKNSTYEQETSDVSSELAGAKAAEKRLRREVADLRAQIRSGGDSDSWQAQYERASEEVVALRSKLARRDSELEENSKMQVELMTRLKEKELRLQEAVEDLHTSKQKESNASVVSSPKLVTTVDVGKGLVSMESPRKDPYLPSPPLSPIPTGSHPSDLAAQKELETLRIELNARENDLNAKIKLIQQKDIELEGLERNVSSLRRDGKLKDDEIKELRTQLEIDTRSAATISVVEERNALLKENEYLKSELASYKSLETSLGELTEVLLSKLRANEIKSSGSLGFSNSQNLGGRTPGGMTPSPTRYLFPEKGYLTSPPPKESSVSAIPSQEHAVWVTLPQIRQLSLPLYECIQKLFQDYHAQFLRTSQQDATIASMEEKVFCVIALSIY